ncbi:hypothetical protein F5X96DRAFT_628561 [Biscogniauxia mediterranea]|nr:hypothetical protein F5X96DRAFT_628561 [Biscogniauxia mediterranea]
MSSSEIPANVASTLQSAHINREPSPAHDLNPSTAASTRRPVKHRRGGSASLYADPSDDDLEADLDYGDEDEGDDVDIPLSVLRRPRDHQHQRHRGSRGSFPPMPDLRFEQSYLHSIRGADTWWKVVWVTVRDQVMMPFAQGILYNLAICGFQHWNRNAQLSGNSAGARIRRWWYGVNKWTLPEKARAKAKTS